MGRKKIPTTVYITPEQEARLKELSELTRVPVAVYVRLGIDAILRQYGDRLPGQLPLFPDLDGGGPDRPRDGQALAPGAAPRDAGEPARPAPDAPPRPRRAGGAPAAADAREEGAARASDGTE